MKTIAHTLHVKSNLHFMKKHFRIPLKKYELRSTPTFKVSSITQMTAFGQWAGSLLAAVSRRLIRHPEVIQDTFTKLDLFG